MKIKNIIITFVSAIAILLSTSVVSFAKVVGDKIVLCDYHPKTCLLYSSDATDE